MSVPVAALRAGSIPILAGLERVAGKQLFD